MLYTYYSSISILIFWVTRVTTHIIYVAVINYYLVWNQRFMIFKNREFRQIRKDKKLVRENVDKKAGIDRVTLSIWKSGK